MHCIYEFILTDANGIGVDLSKKTIFIGRTEQLNHLFNSLDRPKNITVVVGEEGIGKSAILQEIRERLKNSNDPPVMGVSDNNSVIENDSQSLFPHFVSVLESLLADIQKTAGTKEKIDITKSRMKRALEKFGKEKGKEIAVAIVTDMAKKIGLEESVKVVKEFWKDFEEQKSVITVTQDYISKHKNEVLTSYIAIIRSLTEQFCDRKFLLIFDQFESARKTSIDFFIDFVKRMPQERFHIIVSFKTNDLLSDDNSSRELCTYALKKLKEIGADTLEVSGLSEEEIGEWIRLVRKQKLSIVPDLKRIKEVSSGFPLLLEQWINMPLSDTEWFIKAKQSDFTNVNRGQMCELIDLQRESFSNDPSDRVNLNKIAVLALPLKIKELAKYLEYDFDLLYLFLEKTCKVRVIYKKRKISMV